MCIFNKKERKNFSNKYKIIIQNDYEEKACRTKKFGRANHPKNGIITLLSAYWKKFTETGSMDRRRDSRQPKTVSTENSMDLIEHLASSQEERPYTHLVTRKIAGKQEPSVIKNHDYWVKGLETKEKPAPAPLEKDLKVISVWLQKRFGKIIKISLLKFLSFCRTIVFMVEERNQIFLIT